jgi:hypothetical protein
LAALAVPTPVAAAPAPRPPPEGAAARVQEAGPSRESPPRRPGAAERLAAPFRELAPGVQAAPAAALGADPGWGARVLLAEPARVRLLVRFDAGAPLLEEWRRRFPTALAIQNGSFYSRDPHVRPTCDLISDGRAERGAGCRRQDALVFGARAAEGGPPRLLALAAFEPARWTEAMKSFPWLVRDGVPGCGGGGYCDEASRASALAILRDGRVALLATQWPAVRRQIAAFLAEQLGAVDAVNLDGGPEATLALRGESAAESIGTPGAGLPLVLVVLPEEARR